MATGKFKCRMLGSQESGKQCATIMTERALHAVEASPVLVQAGAPTHAERIAVLDSRIVRYAWMAGKT
jgi:hypothetical protein